MANADRRSLGRRWAIPITVIGSSFLIGLLIIEIFLRVVGISFPILVTTDDVMGMALRPNVSGRIKIEGNAWVQINNHGWRDKQRSLEKPVNVYRIAVLGDSYTEAVQVNREEGFVAQIEENLASCAAIPAEMIEVLNFGVGGFGTAQQLLALREHVWKFSPDEVILAFLSGNDVRDNSRELDNDLNVPYFRLESNELFVDNSFLQSPGFRAKKAFMENSFAVFVIDHSRLAQLVNRVRYVIKSKKRAQAAVKNQAPGEEAGLDSSIYTSPKNAHWEHAWELTERLIEKMHAEVRENNARFRVVTLANGIQVWPDDQKRNAFAAKLGVKHLFYPDHRILELGNRLDFPVLNLAEPMQSIADAGRIYFHGFSNTSLGAGHWNADGHKVAGQLIAEELCRDFGSRTTKIYGTVRG